jgi:hypothetical protein
MKKLFIPILLAIVLPFSFSCNSSRLAGYTLNEKDAASAIRELLTLGTRNSSLNGAFGKDIILSTLFPESVKRALNTLNMLGLSSDIDRFTSTLSTVAEKTATASIPIFESGINKMQFTDAMRVIKNGGTSATDYLRTSVGDSLRRSLRPVMQTAVDEYKLTDQWNTIIKPVQSIVGSKFKPDLANVMAIMVSEAMFRKIAEKETQVRSDAAARTTPLLQKVFSRTWN